MVGLIDTESGACAEWTFPAEPDAVRTARHVVREALRARSLPVAVAEMAVLLVSELMTNSLRYASGPIGVRLTIGGGPAAAPAGAVEPPEPPEPPALLVEVSDPLADLPVERTPGPDDERGRGLRLVACSARRWGTRRGKTGKTVWFELPLSG
ncbi:ATP-binding protein [Streptomyces corynorhini]|uniref:ATP-binding protein n=1 Tax=Streptomyces corynorhini TaxID=2282652 RepID=A0A370BIK9_9ACTN|nr:ATP-binding protein [Streptomyces corynorhini]RDG39215.1 ATP-binding protein [Streptomyces corynorhini]